MIFWIWRPKINEWDSLLRCIAGKRISEIPHRNEAARRPHNYPRRISGGRVYQLKLFGAPTFIQKRRAPKVDIDSISTSVRGIPTFYLINEILTFVNWPITWLSLGVVIATIFNYGTNATVFLRTASDECKLFDSALSSYSPLYTESGGKRKKFFFSAYCIVFIFFFWG